MVRWIDTHCHLDAPEFASDRAVVRRKPTRQVAHCVLPAVEVANFDAVRQLAHMEHGTATVWAFIPLYVPQAANDALEQLQATAHPP